MPTIVEYRDGAWPVNNYPDRIVSPTRAGTCCASAAEMIGRPWVEGRGTYQYRRCAACGFTVRAVVATTPDPAVLQSVRQAFRSLFGDRSLEPGSVKPDPSAAGDTPNVDVASPEPAAGGADAAGVPMSGPPQGVSHARVVTPDGDEAPGSLPSPA